MKFAILGLGEAGSHFANDLVSRGHQVKGWDPNLRYPLNEKVEVAQNNLEAVKEVDIIFSANEILYPYLINLISQFFVFF